MPRWEPNAADRLLRAALELFTEQGYEDTTVAQIAERAGLTKSTFFRHFPDKREVLSLGQDRLRQLFADTIADAPRAATPLEVVAAALVAADAVFQPGRRELASQRIAAIAASQELQERHELKQARFAAAMARALRARGLPELTARLAAEFGVLAFNHGYVRWADPANQRPFGELVIEALDELKAASAELGSPEPAAAGTP